jgi:formamidopyrimidine-DNA glycosylase
LETGWGKILFIKHSRVKYLFTGNSRDEILYHAKIHPEQYSNTLNDDQIKELYRCIHYVCSTAIDVLADSEKFPEHWLFKHRWGKGKKNHPTTLPNGDKITFLTVGGRTSAVVPAVQKKTGAVAKEIDENETPANSKRKRAVKQEDGSDVEEKPEPTRAEPKNKRKSAIKKEEDEEKDEVKRADTSIGRRRSTRSRK